MTQSDERELNILLCKLVEEAIIYKHSLNNQNLYMGEQDDVHYAWDRIAENRKAILLTVSKMNKINFEEEL